ncbi:hypothetical protein [Mesorhizobium caraganae]|uniref:hypothetical protein n=1 Tax=Mesorhizobium caraganae TaxID=483206 RepID=UPI00178120EC|nr:hypothetical protein [Mesorhizobium caraganae]
MELATEQVEQRLANALLRPVNQTGKRRLKIFNALFLALSKRGHDGDAYERDGEIHARAIIGDTHLGLDIQIVGSHRTERQHGYMRPAPDLPASTPFALRIDPGFDRKNTVSWQDDGDVELESKIAEIAAAIIVASEKEFRLSLREAEERAERERIEKEKQRQERLVQLNQKRLQNLRNSGELLRQAEDIRALVERVGRAIDEGSACIDASALEAWQRWALAEADRIDPVRFGQILTHLTSRRYSKSTTPF